jgi:hypothetical protein
MMKKYRDGGVYTAEMGKPPQDVDGGSAPPKKPAAKKAPAKKYAAGGDVREGRHSGIDDETRSRATRFAESADKPKPKIVTKEQLKASGFDNLRDYMNAQKGLKRRDDGADVSAKYKALHSAPKGADTAKMRREADSAAKVSPSAKAESKPTTNSAAQGKAAQFIKMSAAERDLPKSASEATRKAMSEAVSRAKKDYESSAKYAKGGSIDGCAIKGKTKGKMV